MENEVDGYKLSALPPAAELETKAVMRKVASAHRFLAELKGKASAIPNESILINTLTLQEAKDSSEIENIITTHHELYKSVLFSESSRDAASKEVNDYANALRIGFDLVRKDKLITVNRLLDIHKALERDDSGIRRLPGTVLKNDSSGKVIYTPPQSYQDIIDLMSNLEKFINDESMLDVDPLIKMVVIHYQFESIHPFYDGNGRTGRILNILYLVAQDLLDIPILYLSGYIIQTKSDYYRLLQTVRDEATWEEWCLYMLTGIEETARQTIQLVQNIKELMQDYKIRIRSTLPKIYSQDLINNLFRHPYTRIDFIKGDLGVSRVTATKYLDQLTENAFLQKHKLGRHRYYINLPLFELFSK